jgi:hypothetical protein
MRWLLGIAAALALAPAAPASAAAPSAPVVVTMDRPTFAAVLGDRFTVRSTMVNSGPAPTGPLLAHLDVVSLHDDVYVDPEDWSSDRSVLVEPLAPGADTTLDWTVRTVDAGEFAVYVVVLPAGPASVSTAASGGTALSVSPALRLAVASRQTLDPGGSAVVVVTVPALVGALALAGRRRRQRRARASGGAGGGDPAAADPARR